MTTTQRHLLLIFLIGAGLFFLGNAAIMITDPVESNYTLTAKEMLFSGDFLSPEFMEIFGMTSRFSFTGSSLRLSRRLVSMNLPRGFSRRCLGLSAFL